MRLSNAVIIALVVYLATTGGFLYWFLILRERRQQLEDACASSPIASQLKSIITYGSSKETHHDYVYVRNMCLDYVGKFLFLKPTSARAIKSTYNLFHYNFDAKPLKISFSQYHYHHNLKQLKDQQLLESKAEDALHGQASNTDLFNYLDKQKQQEQQFHQDDDDSIQQQQQAQKLDFSTLQQQQQQQKKPTQKLTYQNNDESERSAVIAERERRRRKQEQMLRHGHEAAASTVIENEKNQHTHTLQFIEAVINPSRTRFTGTRVSSTSAPTGTLTNSGGGDGQYNTNNNQDFQYSTTTTLPQSHAIVSPSLSSVPPLCSIPEDVTQRISLLLNRTVILYHSADSAFDNILRLFAWYEHLYNVRWTPVDPYVLQIFYDLKRTTILFSTEDSDKGSSGQEWNILYSAVADTPITDIQDVMPQTSDTYLCFKSLFFGIPKHYDLGYDKHLLTRFREYMLTTIKPKHVEYIIERKGGSLGDDVLLSSATTSRLYASQQKKRTITAVIVIDHSLISKEQIKEMIKIANEMTSVASSSSGQSIASIEIHQVDLNAYKLHMFDKVHMLKHVDLVILPSGKGYEKWTLFMPSHAVVIHFCPKDVCEDTSNTIRSHLHVSIEHPVTTFANINMKQFKLDLSTAFLALSPQHNNY